MVTRNLYDESQQFRLAPTHQPSGDRYLTTWSPLIGKFLQSMCGSLNLHHGCGRANVTQLTYQNYNDRPSWSPVASYAFVSMEEAVSFVYARMWMAVVQRLTRAMEQRRSRVSDGRF
jgi:hypothetical protein